MGQGGVIVKQFGGGAGGDPTLFTDTMLAPDQPFLIGDNWFFNWDPNNIQAMSGTQLAGAFNRVATGLQVTNPLGGGTLPAGFGMPRALSWARVTGRSQFAEYRFMSDNSVGGSLTRLGPMVLCTPNQGSCYFLVLIVEAPFQFIITRWTLGAGTNLATSGINAFAANDTLAFSAEIIAGTVQLRAWVNGVNTLSFLDNGGSQFTTGLPGFHVDGISSARNQVFQNFRCGLLNRL